MPETLLSTYSALLYSGALTIGTTSPTYSTATTLPAADGYAFYADVTTITGTSPLLDIELQISPDGGTTWYAWARFAQITNSTTIVQRRLVIQATQGRGEAGTEALVTAGTTASALNANAPAPFGVASTFRIRFTLSGTSCAFGAVKVWVIAAPRATAV